MNPTLCPSLVTIFHIQNRYQLLQTRPTGEKRYQLLQTTHDMYNNDVGKGVVYAYEAYEAK